MPWATSRLGARRWSFIPRCRSADHLLTSAPACTLLLRILIAGVLLRKLVLVDNDLHSPKVGFYAALLVLGPLLDDPVIGTDGQVNIADLGEIQGIDKLLIQLDLLSLCEHIDRRRDVLEADHHLKIVSRSLTLIPRLSDPDVPTLINKILRHIRAIDINAEVALSSLVVFALQAGEVPEQNMSVFDFDVFSDSGISHV